MKNVRSEISPLAKRAPPTTAVVPIPILRMIAAELTYMAILSSVIRAIFSTFLILPSSSSIYLSSALLALKSLMDSRHSCIPSVMVIFTAEFSLTAFFSAPEAVIMIMNATGITQKHASTILKSKAKNRLIPTILTDITAPISSGIQ